jgi:UPF0755 protein
VRASKISLFILLGTSIFIAASAELIFWAYKPIKLHDVTKIVLKKDESLETMSQNLRKQRLIDSPWMFKFWVKLRREYKLFQAGTYGFKGEVSPQNIIAKIVKGDSFQPLALELIIPEGFNLKKLENKLVRFGVAKPHELLSLSRDKEFLKELNIPCLEGFIYPSTYHFYNKKPDVKSVVKKSVSHFFKMLPPDYIAKSKSNNLSLKQAVTFASLIELETSWEDERSKISEVIWNRLRKRIPLGIDAALIYGITDYRGNIRNSHLRDKSNPYNTRIHGGLPPSPIASPRLKSLEAVFTPTNEGYFYFVAKANGNRRHHFSKNYKEHNRYVKKLKKYQKSFN